MLEICTGKLLELWAVNFTELVLPGSSVPTICRFVTSSGVASPAVAVVSWELFRLQAAHAAPAPPTATTAAVTTAAERLVILRMGCSSWNGLRIAVELRNWRGRGRWAFRRCDKDDGLAVAAAIV